VQAKLLRVLQEHELERVGGNRTIKVDVRVIATTNRRLDESIEKKEFRQDLFFRLNVVPIHVPPLRERLDDLPFLAEEFTRRFGRKHGAQAHGLSQDAVRALKAHHWPGNVRELQNVIERAVILSADCVELEPEHLGFNAPAMATPEISHPDSTPAAVVLPGSNGNGSSNGSGFLTMAELEKRHILAALTRCEGNRTHTAKMLKISIRTLRNKLHDYIGDVELAEDVE
jgi:transcriptional regulator with PAS, ATPase and Fis domain